MHWQRQHNWHYHALREGDMDAETILEKADTIRHLQTYERRLSAVQIVPQFTTDQSHAAQRIDVRVSDLTDEDKQCYLVAVVEAVNDVTRQLKERTAAELQEVLNT
jgi:DNA-binding protein YbaB